jgi:hypothetical protein
MSRTSKHTLYALCLIIIATTCLEIPLSGQRMGSLGDVWLKWSTLDKDIFVGAYVAGYTSGRESGCRAGVSEPPGKDHAASDGDLSVRCTQDLGDFDKSSAYLIKRITDFYKQYPGDRDLTPNEILNLVGRGLSSEEIHIHPFPRHNGSLAKP